MAGPNNGFRKSIGARKDCDKAFPQQRPVCFRLR